jgi:hypothetical protein
MKLDNLFDVIQQVGQKPYRIFVNDWARSAITQGQADYSGISSNGFVFKQYKNLEDAFAHIEEIKNKPNKSSYENSALTFVSGSVNGSNYQDFKSFKDFINQPSRSFEKIKEISKTLVENIKTLINLGGLYKNDRIVVTEDTRGIFDFGLASLGLFRPIEFYSQKLQEDIKKGAIENPFKFEGLEAGVVNPDKVNKKIIGGLTFFIFNHMGKEYDCEKRQRGATKVFNSFSNECFLKPNDDGIILTYYLNDQNKVYNGKDNIRLKYASTNKKSYLIYNKKDDSVKNVDIFMPINFIGNVNDSSRGLFLFPAYLISATLEQYGIQSRISAMRLGSDDKTQITVSIPVKDYNESTTESFDSIYALLSKSGSADSFFAFFKIIAENEGIQAKPTGVAYASFNDVYYYERDYMNDMMQRYKNWCEANKDKDFVNTKVVNPNFQFALSTTASNIADSSIKYDNILEYLHQIFYNFYYYMDFLAIEMIDMVEFEKSIYKRITEDVTFRKIYSVPSSKQEIKDLMRSYTIAILVEKYKTVFGGSYSDTPEQVKKKEDTFKDKILKLDEALKSI